MRVHKNLAGIFFFACLVLSSSAFSAVQTLMQIPGIEGEYEDPDYDNWIEISTFTGEIGEGGCDFFSVEKALDSTSSQILASTVLQTIFPGVRVVILGPGPGDTSALRQRITLRNAVISRVSHSVADGDDAASEALVMSAESLELEVYKQLNTGQVVPSGTTTVECDKIKK